MYQNITFSLKVAKRKYFRFDTLRWFFSGFKSPSPQWVKVQLLIRNMIPDGEWIETGTYLGDTTRMLAKHSKLVTSIEPSRALFEFASFRLRKKSNVQLRLGSSEEIFCTSLRQSGPKLNIWLDGHYSGDVTFQGAIDTPVILELDSIHQELKRFDEIKVFIDDVRCFSNNIDEGNGYPKLDFLVSWANLNGFSWAIEHDIFMATRRRSLKTA